MKKVIIMVVAFAMLLAAVPTIASAGGMHHDEEEHMLFGGFNYTDGAAQGTFVSFSIDPNTGEVSNYAVNGTTVFSQVTYENDTNGEVEVNGPVLWYYGFGTQVNWSNHNPRWNTMWRFIHVHDNPAAVFHIVVYGEDTITYRLASGESAKVTGNHTIVINGTVQGTLIFSGKATVEGNEIKIKIGESNYEFGNYTYKGGSVMFIRTNAWHFRERVRNMIIRAIAEGKMGGEIRVGENGKSDFVNYTYGFHARITHQETNRLRLTVESESHEGKVVMITVDKDKLQYDSSHKVVVKLDGKEIRMTSEDEVLAGGSEGKYAVIDGENEVTVMVYVPHFSEHTVDVESQPESVTTEIMGNPILLGAGIAIVLIIVIAAVIILRRR